MLPILLLTGVAGYFFSKNDKTPREEDASETTIPSNEQPNGDNIYQSTQYDAVNREVLERSLKNYADAETPSQTGMIPPFYNTYGMAGSKDLPSELLSSEQLAKIEDLNRYKDSSAAKTVSQPQLENRPMFVEPEFLSKQRPEINLETGMDPEVSILTGLPIEKKHNNMIPFFGSNVKQNVEGFSNESVLDRFTGNTHVFKHKTEVKSFYDLKEQNIYGAPVFTTQIETDRYIPSLYKQSEKPFLEERIAAPIAGTVDNIVRPEFKQVDDLRAANKPKVSYDGRFIAGQRGEVRGVQAEAFKHRPDTYYEQGQDRLLTTTGKFINPKMDENFLTNFKNTGRQDYNIEYTGIAKSDNVKQRQRTKMIGGGREEFQNENSQDVDQLVQIPKRMNFENDYVRNASGSKRVHDFGKSGITSYETERATSGLESHVLNANRQQSGFKTALPDHAKATIRETTSELPENTGHVKTTFDLGSIAAYHSGLAQFDMRTTNKEITSDKSEYTGAAGSAVHTNTKVYSTYFNPEKVRNAIHVDYSGNANYNSESVSRENYNSAEIRENKEIVISGERPSGPQNFQISGGRHVVGEVKSTDNLLIKEQLDRRPKLNPNFPQHTTSKTIIGHTTNPRFDDNDEDLVFANRLQADLVISQHNQNPYSLYGTSKDTTKTQQTIKDFAESKI